jgi:hypothetical protein
MTLNHNNEPLTGNRIAAGALAALGAASAIPIPLAQLDFAGLINVFTWTPATHPGHCWYSPAWEASSRLPSS